MSPTRAIAATGLGLLLAGCGGSQPAAHTTARSAASTTARSAASTTARSAASTTARSAASTTARPAPRTATRRRRTDPPQALVTDETQNRLLVVDLRSGRVVRHVALPPDPEDVAGSGGGGVVVVVSSHSGVVTVLNRQTLRRIHSFGGFDEPHIAAISPDGQHAYVTDDSRGTVTVIRLSDMRVTSTVAVGTGAHHLAFSPNQRRLWVALGESATSITILDTSNADHPRVVGHFSPGFPVHDLAFTPNGREVWVTSAAGDDVTAFDARTHRALFRIPVGPPPQHLVFDGRVAYITSGYGSTIEEVAAATDRVLARATSPYGSFELDAADGYVATSSLLRGTLAIYTPRLAELRVVRVAPEAREVAISRP
jgi:DNA-binding beta-propeller fold protein YncE